MGRFSGCASWLYRYVILYLVYDDSLSFCVM